MASKYRAVAVTVDGYRFASKKEAARYRVLKAMEAAGDIRRLELQPKYPLLVNGAKCGFYVGDFRYERRAAGGWEAVLEDVKGVRTPVYRLKKKLVKALYGIDILET